MERELGRARAQFTLVPQLILVLPTRLGGVGGIGKPEQAAQASSAHAGARRGAGHPSARALPSRHAAGPCACRSAVHAAGAGACISAVHAALGPAAAAGATHAATE